MPSLWPIRSPTSSRRPPTRRPAIAGSEQSRQDGVREALGNYSCLYAWLVSAGFVAPQRKLVYRLKAGTRGQRRWHVAFEARAPA